MEGIRSDFTSFEEFIIDSGISGRRWKQNVIQGNNEWPILLKRDGLKIENDFEIDLNNN